MALLKNLKNFMFEENVKPNNALSIDEKQKQSNNAAKKNTISAIKSHIIKSMGLLTFTSYNREAFIAPEYNLDEIRAASEADSYIKMALMKYSYLIYKAGWTLKGEDDRVTYLNQRFRMMSFSTGKPMDILFQEIADDMVRYSNAFLVKARVDSIPGINAKPIFGNKKVIGGYYRVDPSSIIIERDKSGNVKRYRQGVGEDERYFSPNDMIHFYMDRDANNAFGTPRIIAALEDVQLLRKIEGNIVSLIYRFSRPIFHWKIGNAQQGMQATEPEIEEAKRKAENMSYESMVITNEKTEIKAIGAEGTALNAEGYLKYFEERVWTALGVSATQMGRGTDKSSADSMDEQAHDVVKYIQRILAALYENFVLGELLLEGGYNPIMNEEDLVKYEFEEISLDTKIKKENHEMTRWQGNMTTLEEARRTMGMKDSPDSEDRLYKNLIEKNSRLEEIDRTAEHQMNLQKMSIDAQKEIAKNNAKASAENKTQGATGSKGGSTKPKSTKQQGPNKDAENKNRPENQHGKTSVKIKESLNMEEKTFKGFTKKNFKKEYDLLFKKYSNLRNDIKEQEDVDLIMPLSRDEMANQIIQYINNSSVDGVNDAIKDINSLRDKHQPLPKNYPILNDFYEEVNESLKATLTSIKEKLQDESNDIDAVFDTYEYRIRFLADYVTRKAYWYSYVKTGAELDIKKAYVLFNSKDDKKGNKTIIDTESFTYEDIPAYHAFCNCEVTFDKKEYDKHKEQQDD